MKENGVVRPYSEETNDDATLSNYPKLIYLLHADDYTAGQTNFAPRVGTATLTYGNILDKDAEGYIKMLSPGIQTSTFPVTGAMPTYKVGKHYLQIHTATSPDEGGNSSFRFGPTTAEGHSFSHNGAVFVNGTQAISPIIFAGFAPVENHCDLAYFDMVSTALPVGHYKAWYSEDGLTVFKGDGTAGVGYVQTSAPAAAGNLTPNQGISICLANRGDIGQRWLLGALFELDTAPTYSFMDSCCAWMAANPGKLYPGLRHIV